MTNTFAGRLSVLVGTALEFIHICFVESILNRGSGSGWLRLPMPSLVFLGLVLRLQPVLIRLAIVPASLLVNFVGPGGDVGCTIERLPGQQRGLA